MLNRSFSNQWCGSGSALIRMMKLTTSIWIRTRTEDTDPDTEVNSSVEIGTSSRANSCRASAVPIFCILQSCHLSRASPGLCWQVTSLDSFLPPILGTARGPFQLVPSRASARKQSAKNVKWAFRKNTIVVCVVSFDPDQLETSSFF